MSSTAVGAGGAAVAAVGAASAATRAIAATTTAPRILRETLMMGLPCLRVERSFGWSIGERREAQHEIGALDSERVECIVAAERVEDGAGLRGRLVALDQRHVADLA